MEESFKLELWSLCDIIVKSGNNPDEGIILDLYLMLKDKYTIQKPTGDPFFTHIEHDVTDDLLDEGDFVGFSSVHDTYEDMINEEINRLMDNPGA